MRCPNPHRGDAEFDRREAEIHEHEPLAVEDIGDQREELRLDRDGDGKVVWSRRSDVDGAAGGGLDYGACGIHGCLLQADDSPVDLTRHLVQQVHELAAALHAHTPCPNPKA